MKSTLYRNFKINYRENTADELVLEHSFDKDIFMSSIPYYKIKKDCNVIDVGAHIGTFALFIADKATQGKFYALEPSQDTFDVLQMNVIDNKLEHKMFPIQIALYDQDSSIKLFHDEGSGNWGHSIVSELSQSFEEVNTQSPDTFFAKNNIAKCDLIKFNCEGAEFKIIAAMSDKVLNKINTWIILFHEDLEKEGNHKEIIKRLKKNNFIVNLIRVTDEGKRGWITATKNYSDYYKFSIISKLKKLLGK